MKTLILSFLAFWTIGNIGMAQFIPLDTTRWEIQARSYVLENYMGSKAIYLQAGAMSLKDAEFLNGTIEYDILLKEEQAFPGVYFRVDEEGSNAEHFYLRPHLPGKPDANQAAPLVRGITPWQLCFGPTYSFPYEYKYDDWTHVKMVVRGDKAQVFLDNSESPNLSWELFHETQPGGISLTGGNQSGLHIANVRVSYETPELVDFDPVVREPIPGLIQTWSISDKFTESRLEALDSIAYLIDQRKWQGDVAVEEGTAVNISRIQKLNDGTPGNTVFARVMINSDSDQVKLLEFGYSDRVVVILNGNPIYKGTNRWRSRDYRYLGTIGLFDSVYLDLKKGRNELLMAVSEDFGGWLVTARFKDPEGTWVR